VSPDRIELTGRGSIERRPLVLNQAAVLTRSGDGWALSPTSLSFAGGKAVLSGRSGSHPEVHAQLQSMPLQVLDLGWPDLDLSGVATGRVDYAWKGNRSGRADLRVAGRRSDVRKPVSRRSAVAHCSPSFSTRPCSPSFATPARPTLCGA
jgi:translocation and assembly module TamB